MLKIQKLLLVYFVVITSDFLSCDCQGDLPTIWPRDNDIIGYWPLGNFKTIDVAKGTESQSYKAHNEKRIVGPFGYFDTSSYIYYYYNSGKTCENGHYDCYVMRTYQAGAIKQKKSFTVSIFAKPSGKRFYQVDFKESDTVRIQFIIDYSTGSPKLQIWDDISQSTIGLYEMFQYHNNWNFYAVVFDGDTCELSLYNRFGMVYRPQLSFELCQQVLQIDAVEVGALGSSSDLSSCFMLHSATLNEVEITKSYEACKIIHNSAPCGVSKFPYTPIPNAQSTTPSTGQFPFIANLRLKSQSDAPVCAASIVDRRRLLTLGSCFRKLSVPSSYDAYFGDFNYAISELDEFKISVSNITFGRFYDGNVTTSDVTGDIAIVELTSDIPYESGYVNEMCLPLFDWLAPTLIRTAYFFGWGEGGRSKLQSKSAPRYTAGYALDDGNCSLFWGEMEDTLLEENSRVCFESSLSSMIGVPCKGDEGGPLMVGVGTGEVHNPERLMQVGIYGFRDDECSELKPPVFTRISAYMRWIENQLACTSPGIFYPKLCPMTYR